ncbi:hypothetical protein [Microbacterium sulfonylureivorans]|uniref:hypothetical protein n=1 Tax=Microbacterium sulfonylureivorans TaxID=2486854 RepID=UPI000FDC659F|nr:hypothetical protein [Microbacterium sulfonylureivorans]
MTDASATAVRDARTTWLVGGSLLIAYAVFPLLARGVFLPGGGFVSSLLWAGALLVFAVGIRGSGSVVGRRPLGVTAFAVAALLPLATTALWSFIPIEAFPSGAAVMLGQGIGVVSLAALLIATVQLARGGAVPSRWRWLPLILLVACALTQAAVEAAVLAQPDLTQDPYALLFLVVTLVPTASTLTLGIMAIILAPRTDARAASDSGVQVYPPAS